MSKFADNLWRDLAEEHGPALARAGGPEPGHGRRSRVIAGGTLAVAVAGTALGLGLTSASGTAASGTTKVVTAAYTITENSDGSVLVQVNQEQSIVAADAKLASMGIHEKVSVFPKSGAAAVSGPVTCTPVDGASKQETVRVLLGTNGTEVIAPGTTGDNTGVGTWHLGSCVVFPADYKGNSGAGNAG